MTIWQSICEHVLILFILKNSLKWTTYSWYRHDDTPYKFVTSNSCVDLLEWHYKYRKCKAIKSNRWPLLFKIQNKIWKCNQCSSESLVYNYAGLRAVLVIIPPGPLRRQDWEDVSFLSNYCLFVSKVKSLISLDCIPVINFFPRLKVVGDNLF